MVFEKNSQDGGASSNSGHSQTKRVAVIGAGISGIIAASVLQKDGHDVVVFERHKQAGGVWRYDAAPGVRLQNMFSHYRHPDLDWQFEPDLHPTGAQILEYLEYCIRKFKLQIQYETSVIEMQKLEKKQGWKVVVEQKRHKRESLEFDYCVIAQGQYSKNTRSDNEMSSLMPWEGVDEFRKAGGNIYTRHDMQQDFFDDMEGKNVAVVGFGKTALDACHYAARWGSKEIHHVFRNPRWPIPSFVFGIHHTWLIFTRLNQSLIPAWDQPSGRLRSVHQKYQSLIVLFWAFVERVAWFQFCFSSGIWWKHQNIRRRFQQLKPETTLLMEHRSAAAICPSDYYPLVAQGRIVPTRGTVRRFTSKGLEMEDGTTIAADTVFACVGNGDSPAAFPYLPEEYRTLLESDKGGAQLYRHLLHPRVPDLAFAGWNHGFLHCAHAYLGMIWISCMLRGEVVLPSKEKQLAAISSMARWKKKHIVYEPALNSSVNTRILHYNDVLMSDLGCDPYRKSNVVLEIFARYDLEDYSGILGEIQKRREEAQKEGSQLLMNPVDVDM